MKILTLNASCLVAFVIITLGGLLACDRHSYEGHGHGGHGKGSHDRGHHHEIEHSHEESFEQGPHGGRLLRDKEFAAEVAIYEEAVRPEFRVYFYEQGKLLSTDEAKVDIVLTRLGGRTDRFTFRPRREFLGSVEPVELPHSFDVSVEVEHGGHKHAWEYQSYEGRVELDEASLAAASVEIAEAGPVEIRTTLKLSGQIQPNEDQIAHMIPRFPGVVKEARKHLGDPVKKGEVVAVVQSNASLESYSIRSEITGTVIKKHVTPGEFVAVDDDVYVVADLSTVWIDLNVYRQDFDRLEVGQTVHMDTGKGLDEAVGKISYISPFGAAHTQTMLARVVLPNPDGRWRPGLFVSAEVSIDESMVPVAVKRTGIQRFNDADVVFARVGDVFEARPLELGRHDGEWVEVLSGIDPGVSYAAANSFIMKAELGKAGASHDH